jgi:serine phosphatase RsbU (regulator of sigma subunit)
LGDVCGKGIGAALLVANLQATIRAQRELARDPAKLMHRVNYLFFESTRPEHFATLFYGVYDSGACSIRYVNCGHPSPVVVRADGSFELLEATATVLGAFQERGFEEQTVRMGSRDRVVLFSDGFAEAKMDEADDWATQTVLKLARNQNGGLAGTLASRAAEQQSDDITVMDIRVL